MPKLTAEVTAPIAPKPVCPQRPLALRLASLNHLLGALLGPAPQAWQRALAGQQTHISTLGGNEPSDSNSVAIRTCESYDELVNAWKKAMKWYDGLDHTLSAMLASSMSTQFVGEQLWFLIEGPPSSGKTSLMEGLATARKWYLSKDTIRGFHSGWKRDDGKDVSLAQMVNGMTLGTKDGDTLLKAPNLTQILAEARALYDKVSRTNYRNDINREYMGHRMTWHLAGTKAIHEIDDSELGARFLCIVAMGKIDEAFEDTVARMAARQEARNMLMISDGKPESQHPAELANAMALSGGYLDFLRNNALELSKSVRVSDRCLDRCGAFGKFIAFMRARASRKEAVVGIEREFSPRLVKQLTRLMIAEACTLGKCETDDEVMSRVHKVMMDTSQGPTLDLINVLGPHLQGMEVRGLATLMSASDEGLRKQLKFLRKIGVVETDVNWKRWRITPSVYKLWNEVKNA